MGTSIPVRVPASQRRVPAGPGTPSMTCTAAPVPGQLPPGRPQGRVSPRPSAGIVPVPQAAAQPCGECQGSSGLCSPAVARRCPPPGPRGWLAAGRSQAGDTAAMPAGTGQADAGQRGDAQAPSSGICAAMVSSRSPAACIPCPTPGPARRAWPRHAGTINTRRGTWACCSRRAQPGLGSPGSTGVSRPPWHRLLRPAQWYRPCCLAVPPRCPSLPWRRVSSPTPAAQRDPLTYRGAAWSRPAPERCWEKPLPHPRLRLSLQRRKQPREKLPRGQGSGQGRWHGPGSCRRERG